MNYDAQTYVKPGDPAVLMELHYSEAAMYLGVAGRILPVQLQPASFAAVAQVYRIEPDGRTADYSFPITHGEAGFYYDEHGYYYYPPTPQELEHATNATDLRNWLQRSIYMAAANVEFPSTDTRSLEEIGGYLRGLCIARDASLADLLAKLERVRKPVSPEAASELFDEAHARKRVLDSPLRLADKELKDKGDA